MLLSRLAVVLPVLVKSFLPVLVKSFLSLREEYTVSGKYDIVHARCW